jgi:predicted lipoprotein with Yx(FWY)xxD motif
MRATGRHHTATTQRGLTSGVAAAVLVLLVVGCGSTKTKTTTATSAAAAASPGAAGSTGAVKVATAKSGQVLANAQGMTLYTFDPENSGKIACLTGCVDKWPPDLVAGGGAAPTAGNGVMVAIATIARPDGGSQVTAGGHPLYTFAGDKAPGDSNGDGIGGKWHVATPTGGSAGAGSTPTTAGGYRY